MGIIQELDIQLANKIAAGEVVERPASVVKELVENAIDAGSTQITVKVTEAGLKYIIVTDNGTGILEEDLPLALSRHATSKIKSNHDLFHIRTLGFRGEALASIAAVSKVTLKTCADGQLGHLLKVDGHTMEKSLTRAKQGTEIIVSDLFYNTPARLKYVKSLHTELGKITDIMNRFAMSHSHIRFTFYADDKVMLQTTGNGRLSEVMSSIYGMKIARDLVEISGTTGDYMVTGLVAKPEHTRANRHYISIFINGRYIRNFMLTKAIMTAYHTLLPIGRYPIGAINIVMDPALVDVNVHPTKQEVRLSKEAELMSLIEQLIKQALLGQSLIPKVEVKKNKVLEKFEQQKLIYDQQNLFKNEETIDLPLPEHHHPTSENHDTKNKTEIREAMSKSNYELPNLPADYEPKLNEASVSINESEDSTLFDSSIHERKLPYMEVVGQVHGTYIVAQNEGGMYMIDQHAAQERIKYEYFKKRIGNVTHAVQPLLFPITLSFTNDEALRVSRHVDELHSVGITLENFGGNDYLVREVPTWFPEDAEETIKDIIDYCLNHQSVNLHKFREETAIMMSCKKSIKANHYLRHEDMTRLIKDLSATSEPYTCPHGRPITIQFTSYDLEKLFKRVM
ncbi:DNA mismatch repair endonuclease MutL [Macrococcus lamae]|uniref:DNA mismatch repair protein MutL n=1 Tax=Macrococcus lamae TaxID=198484 RepID=A0A4R6BU94_9STAP|nr:DNA mismatch repair endonuclease MutL [Macrococcus lamae]TDM11850.1 DNA mismatch repair endonuclease MutL [Macrococcus lamae]